MKTLRELRDGKNNHSPDKHRAEYKDILLDELREIENIRTAYPEETIKELAESIERDGLLQPIVVIEDGEEDGRTIYKVIAGHRRLRAYQYLRAQDKPSYNQIKAIARKSIGDIETVQLIENIQREDLNSADLEKAVKSIMKREGLKQADLAQRIGKSKQWVSMVLKAHEIRDELTKSPTPEKSSQLDFQKIPSSTLSTFSGIKDKEKRKEAVKETVKRGGTQKKAKEVVRETKGKPETSGKHHDIINLFYREADKMDGSQLAHIIKAVLEESLSRLKGKDRLRAVEDIKIIIKRYK